MADQSTSKSAGSGDYGVGVYLGPDVTHVDARKRTLALELAGVDLTSFMFRRRGKNNADYVPEWRNIELGITEDRNYSQRVKALAAGLKKLVDHRDLLREARFIMARNYDQLSLAVSAKKLTGTKAKIVYDVPDVQEFMFGTGAKGKFFRSSERSFLNAVDLLVITSPGYLRGYFKPVQGYDGPVFIWENKNLSEQIGDLPPPEQIEANRRPPMPWVLAWHGTLRCPKTMTMLSETATHMGDALHISMRGKPTNHPEHFKSSFDGVPNAVFGGEYKMPDDLLEIYQPAHFVWCPDYFDEFGNSPLLLPNRIYQGGYLGVVPIGVKGQETAEYIKRHDIGAVIAEPTSQALSDFFSQVTLSDYERWRTRLYAMREDLFVEDASDVQHLLQAIEAA